MATHSMIRGLVLSGISLKNNVTYRGRSPFSRECGDNPDDSLMIIMNCINLVDMGCMMARHLMSCMMFS